MIKINRYDVIFKFLKGEGFVILDVFSRVIVVIYDEFLGIWWCILFIYSEFYKFIIEWGIKYVILLIKI